MVWNAGQNAERVARPVRAYHLKNDQTDLVSMSGRQRLNQHECYCLLTAFDDFSQKSIILSGINSV